MANRFLNNIRINDAYTFPASDGNDGQVITTDGAGNLAFENVSPDAASVIYRDNFTGDGSTVTFDLQNSITDEDQTQIYIDGVYQEKSTYSISGTTITFTTAPISGHSVEVISISSINTGPTVLYQDNFTGNGSDTAFTLGQIIDNEIKTFIFLNGVYQFKNTYTVDGTTLTFDTAPANGVAIEVVSIASAVQSDSLEAGSVIIPVKNTHTASISKGTPVYITGNVGASERLQIAPADASNSAKMPAAGLLLTTLAVNEQGYVITGGYLRNLTTDTIDSTSTSSNDTVYVKAGGGLTMTKPTGSNLIQNIAKVARSASGSSGSLIVSSILRTNDIPNLTTGKIWVGDSNTVESTVIHLDESNNRLGINNNNPSYSLDVTGDANISSNVIVGGNLTVQGTETILNTQTVEVEDNILQLNTTQGSPDTATATTSGISIYRGNGVTQASFIFDDADDTWDLTNNLVVADSVTTDKIIIDGASNSNISQLALTRTDFSWGIFNETNLRFYVQSGNTTTPNTEVFEIATNGNATFAGDVYATGSSNSNVVISRDNMYVDAGQFYIGADDAATDDTFRQRVTSGSYFIESRKSGTWTNRLQINSAGTLIASQGATFAAAISAVGASIFTLNDGVFIKAVNGTNNVASTNVWGYGLYEGASKLGEISLVRDGSNNQMYVGTSTTNQKLRLGSGNKVTAITIDGSQNVGIGETSPSRKLHIKNTDDTRGILVENTLATSYAELHLKASREFRIGTGGVSSATDARDRFYVYDATAAAHRFTIDSSGNVGIGTTNPDTILEIASGNSEW